MGKRNTLMFGLTEYIAAAAVIAAVGWGGVQQIRLERMKNEVLRAQTSEARVISALETCANRLINIKEAAESNALIPDDLGNFTIPDSWMHEPSATDPATD